MPLTSDDQLLVIRYRGPKDRRCDDCGQEFHPKVEGRYRCPICFEANMWRAYGEFVKATVDLDEKRSSARMMMAGIGGAASILMYILYAAMVGGGGYIIYLVWLGCHHKA